MYLVFRCSKHCEVLQVLVIPSIGTEQRSLLYIDVLLHIFIYSCFKHNVNNEPSNIFIYSSFEHDINNKTFRYFNL